ncbi:MAG: bifunctional nuclease domain-containing protein [Bacteroidales bacterium]
MEKIKLNVLGISYSQTQTGAYALVLTEEKGERRIPIIIGGFEAQSIAIQLEGLKPPRPLTHDLFHNFALTFKINLKEVIIYKLEEGVFYSKLICNNGDEDVTIDARTSDAVALALRFKCPIYTTEEILSKSGIVIDLEQDKGSGEVKNEKKTKKTTTGSTQKYKDMDLDELEGLLEEAVKNEEYEKASAIRDEINRRKKQ